MDRNTIEQLMAGVKDPEYMPKSLEAAVTEALRQGWIKTEMNEVYDLYDLESKEIFGLWIQVSRVVETYLRNALDNGIDITTFASPKDICRRNLSLVRQD